MGLTETELYDDPADPFRPVDWRWRRAVYLLENNPPVSPRRDDAWARAAVRFYQGLRQCQDEAARQGLARRLPAIFQAHALYAGPPSLARWHLEARLLTPESFGQVAAKCRTTPEVVEAYESLFFCIRDRLHVEGYIVFYMNPVLLSHSAAGFPGKTAAGWDTAPGYVYSRSSAPRPTAA